MAALSPVDAHEVAAYVVMEACDVGERIAALENSIDDFLGAFEDLEPFVEAVRWLTGRATSEMSAAAVEVVRQTRDRWEAIAAEDTFPEDVASTGRRMVEFERVLKVIDGAV